MHLPFYDQLVAREMGVFNPAAAIGFSRQETYPCARKDCQLDVTFKDHVFSYQNIALPDDFTMQHATNCLVLTGNAAGQKKTDYA
jgi:hypothetical protein